MSQYSSFLATAPALQVLERTSSPESIRQFGNPSQLAKPWFIFRRPSETRYTPRKEVQQLEESHDDSITSVMSSTNPESILHEEIDCVATTAAEEVTATEVPKIILHEQTDIRSSTDITISEPSTNPGLIFKVSENSNADIYYVTTTASEEITATEVPKIILYEQTDIRSSTDVTILGLSTNLEPISKGSENSNADIYYVTTTASEEITATEVPKIILYEQTDIRSSTDVTILGLSTNLEPISKVSECSNKHVNSVSDITIFGPSTHPEPILKVSEHSSEDVDLISYIAILGLSTNLEPTFKVSECSSQPVDSVSDFATLGPATESELIGSISESSSEHVDFVLNISAEATHPRLFANPEHIPAVLHTDIDSIASTTSEEIIQYEQIDNRSSTDASIFELSTNPELSKRSSQHVDSVSDITVIRPSTILELISKASKLPSQHVDSVSDISSAETTHLNISTNPESVSHANIDSVATAMSPDFILYEPIDIRSSTDVTIFEPSPHLELNQVSESSSQHVSDISSAETTHLKLSTNPAPMPSALHTDIDSIATSVGIILYEQIDNRSSTDVTTFEPTTGELTVETSKRSSQHIDSVSDIATLGPSTNLEPIFKVFESSSQHANSISDISTERTHLRLSRNLGPMPVVSHAHIYCDATTTEKITVINVPTIPENIPCGQVDIDSCTDIIILEPKINLEPSDCISDIASTDMICLRVPTTLESMPEVCICTKTEDITAAEPSINLEIALYEQTDISSSTDITAEHSNQPIGCVSAITSHKITSHECSATNPDSDKIIEIAPTKMARLRRSTKPEPIKPASILSQDTKRTSNASSAAIAFMKLATGPEMIVKTPQNISEIPKIPSQNIDTRPSSKLLQPGRSTTNSPRRVIPVQVAATTNSNRPRSTATALHFPPKGPDHDGQRPAIAAGRSARLPNVRVSIHLSNSGSQRSTGKPSPPAKSALPKKFGSSRFAGSILHLPTADEDEARKRHALTDGKLKRASKAGIFVRPPGAGIKRISGRGKMVQERVGSNATLAVMTEVVEEEEEVAKCHPIPAAEKGEGKVEEKVVEEEERGAAISRSVEISGAWPFSHSRNVRRKAIVWRKLDNIAEEECEADEPVALVAQCELAAAAQKDLEEAPIVNGEEEGGVSVETPSPEDQGEKTAEVDASTGIDPVAPRPIPYPVPSRWSSRIGEIRVSRRPSYNWKMACSSDVIGPELKYVERVRYPAPMRWSSRIGEVKRARTLRYAGLQPPGENPELEGLSAPEGAVLTLGSGEAERGLSVFSGLVGEVGTVPQQQEEEEEEEEESNLSEWRENEGKGAKKVGSFRRRAKQVWKKIGRVFSGGRG